MDQMQTYSVNRQKFPAESIYTPTDLFLPNTLLDYVFENAGAAALAYVAKIEGFFPRAPITAALMSTQFTDSIDEAQEVLDELVRIGYLVADDSIY